MAELSQEQVRSLDQIRARLLTLCSSLGKLQQNLLVSQPLPSAATLQISASVISNSLQTITEQLAEHQELLSSTIVFPLPQYPGKYQGHILTDTLLRTKLEPDVEEWLAQGENLANQQSTSGGLSEADRNKLWRWAPEAANREARKQKWGADYTLAEVKNGVEKVGTGLNRQLEEPDDDDDDDDDGSEADGEEEEEEAEGGEAEDADKMDIDQSMKKSDNAEAASNVEKETTIAGRPAYLETLQEYLTTGRIQRYEPLLVEQRREAEKKKQSTQAI